MSLYDTYSALMADSQCKEWCFFLQKHMSDYEEIGLVHKQNYGLENNVCDSASHDGL